ncbi:glycosyltransferase family 4 protein [Tenacibaculum finnmarkense]|uniref:glycosyltransferase family 4 protein n=1 Tax=Tenacibaculum finnmarkense TaxID=2781243 RepID=UPI001E5F9318|nr:glycosyltransferase family 4 protein [Tenacibaculum finnmarkense]MCD8411724.1 glycosyltransferase family 4 protein [Tenacibaculum finnmarkense genomovar ulcerans]MCG8206782.1 glycosyltransferase family 4 protein [Tenacibaculum finnmarkense genomovar finnmarkense]MCG8723040.1 glycosyltransferase family 4 protein [Tenacibaculum finnmarkense]MCG8741308.1 glycosyltransferase family 4 protein [Tenacibaculum finnmarkense]MCG8764651.1 glycosyltransferase family 4 protein [Tenacibaculum finnmarkens
MSTELFGVNKKKQIWLVSELFYPETISTGYIMTEIAISLARNHEVMVVCGPEFYEKKNNKITIKPLDNITTYRVKSKPYNKNRLISRIFGHLRVTYKMLSLMRKEIPKDVDILMVTNPVLLFVLTSLIAKKRKWKMHLLVHDVFPENLVLSGFLKSKTSFFFRKIKSIFNNSFKKMDVLIVLGQDMLKLFELKIGKQNGISIIENWADTNNIKKHKIDTDLSRKFLFAGNMGRLQGIEVLLKAIKNTEKAPYIFSFIGSGALDQYIENFIINNKSINIEKQGWVSRENQDKFLAEATIGVVTLKKGMYGLGVPSKFYNLLAAGKPVFYIGDVNSEIHIVLQKHKIGWFAEAGNLDEISKVLLKIADEDVSKIIEYSKNARALAENEYSKQIILNKFNNLFKN